MRLMGAAAAKEIDMAMHAIEMDERIMAYEIEDGGSESE